MVDGSLKNVCLCGVWGGSEDGGWRSPGHERGHRACANDEEAWMGDVNAHGLRGLLVA